MALFLLYRTNPEDRNSNNIHSVLVEAADELEARAKAKAAAPNGETKVPDSWAAVNLGDGAIPTDLQKTMLWFEGDCISALGVSRAGSPVR
jgi:hypothetical protein